MIRFVLAVTFAVMLTLPARAETAIVAGGCFWCVEADFESVPGVGEVVSGFTGGTSDNPTYDNHAGHYEAVSITFDPERISFDNLIAVFLRSVDVTDAGGQFCDRGPSYRTAIFVNDARQRMAAEAAVAEAAAALGQPVVTPILPATTFWPAEEYHQDYAKGSRLVLTRAGPKTQANAYTFYRKSCGRDAGVQALWGNDAAFAR